MKLMRKILKSKNGLSLVEILIAMVVLALVAGPICKCFIMSAEINRKARKRMCANDCAQTIMEGFADKTYDEIVDTIKALNGAGAISPQRMFSKINDNVYNTNTTLKDLPMGPNVSVNSISKNSISTSAGSFDTKNINVSENLVVLGKINESIDRAVKAEGDVKGLYSFKGASNIACALEYCDVQSGSYNFDVVVSFYPMAENSSDSWYPYLIYLTVYDHGDDDNNTIVYLKSGTRNKRQK